MKLSIIVPVYNVEKYIEQCIVSIIKQDYSEFECILVDDGSTDLSGVICDKWAKKDRRFQVIHKKNGGLMSAWKCGAIIAQGEYVGFVDSDDWIDGDMYSTMINIAEKYDADIVCSAWVKEFKNGTTEKENVFLKEGLYNKAEIKGQILPRILFDSKTYTRGISPNRVTKVFKKCILAEIFDECDERVSIGEDLLTTFIAMQIINRLYIIREFYPYHYRIHEQSMIVKYSPEKINRIDILHQYLKLASSKYTEYNYNEQVSTDYVSSMLAQIESQILVAGNDYFSCKRNAIKIFKSEEFRNSLLQVKMEKSSPKMRLYVKLMNYHLYFCLYIIRRLKR